MYLKKELYELIRTDESIFDFIQDSSLDGLWYWDLENPENEMLGGNIWVESKEGMGSTFYFTLPYNTETLIKTSDE